MTRDDESPRSTHTHAVRAIGGVEAAERAEQLRARGIATGRVAEQLRVPAAAVEAYYALQEELAAPPRSWLDGPLLGLDLETTGPDPETARVVQWVLVNHAPRDAGKPVLDRRAGLVDPGVPILPQAQRVHRITDAAVRKYGASPWPAMELLDIALTRAASDRVPVVAYNAVYDLTVLDRECARHALPGHIDDHPRLYVIDPYMLDRGVDRYGKGKRTLTDLARHYGVEQHGAHDALADVETTLALVPAIVERHPRLAQMTLDQLQNFQAATMRDWAAALARYFARQGHPRVVDSSWPIRPARAELEIAL